MVLVSVIMGSYNHQSYISEAIESILNQTFPDLELIIVDDYSTDNSRRIIENYQAKDERVKAFFHEKNMGIANTINDALKKVKGQFISFIGSDDVWFPYKLERQLALIKKNENRILWSEGEIIDGSGAFTGRKITQLLNSPPRKCGNIFEELLREDIIFGQSLLFKTEYAKDLKFDPTLKYANDHLFFVNLARNHDFIFTEEPLAKYRIHGNNITFKNGNIWLKERIIIRSRFLQKFSQEISNQTKADIYYKIGHALSRLDRKELAKQYYFKAIRIDPFHANSILYLIFALTDGEGFTGRFLSTYYNKVISLFS